MEVVQTQHEVGAAAHGSQVDLDRRGGVDQGGDECKFGFGCELEGVAASKQHNGGLVKVLLHHTVVVAEV